VLTLPWATYYDAADAAGIFRLDGGIHVPPDNFAGRIMGSTIGIDADKYASRFFSIAGDFDGDGWVGFADFLAFANAFGMMQSKTMRSLIWMDRVP